MAMPKGWSYDLIAFPVIVMVTCATLADSSTLNFAPCKTRTGDLPRHRT